MLSVQRTLEGTQSTFFRLTLRLKMCVNSKVSFASWHSSLATERPTVPKPAIAIFNFFLRETGFLFSESGLLLGLGFRTVLFCRQRVTSVGRDLFPFPKTPRIIRYFGIQPWDSDGMARSCDFPWQDGI